MRISPEQQRHGPGDVRGGAPIPVWRIGMVGGLIGMLCCVGPTVLALVGVIGAGTAFAWAHDLYGGYTWWFRLAGLAALAVMVAAALRSRRQCNLAGMTHWRARIAGILVVGVGTYAVLYGVTTWLGTFA